MKFNSARLTVARQRRLLNKKHFAEKIGVDVKTIIRWENHESEPTEDSVTAVAKLLRFPRAFFFGSDVDQPLCEHISFRSQTSMTAAERDAALAAGQIAFLISDWTTARFDLPECIIPDLHLSDPEAAARLLRQEWALGEKPIGNMIHLLEAKGVRVFSLAENTTHVNAYSLWRRGTPYVFLNTFKTAESSRFDAAHELGHLVLHQDGGVTGRIAEEQAHKFAAAFLMPEADVRASFTRIKGLQDLITAKKRWKVSVAALNYRLHKVGLISDWKNREFCIHIAKKRFNVNEPEPIDREQSAVWQKVLTALWAEKTTHIDIADQLALPISEVCDLLLGVLPNIRANKIPPESQLRVLD